MNILKGIFGTQNERNLKKIYPIVDKINSFEQSIKKLSDQEILNKKIEFKKRLNNGETLDDLLPEAFACAREAAWRTLGQRHYDVQLIGAVALHKGMIAEMKTGEGKTLAATASVYLNALTSRGVHIVTVNDYLAKRDSEWMGPIYKMLGMSVGVILETMDNEERKSGYSQDITYGTNNQFGFDYLRDNMVHHFSNKVQRGFYYCIVDEIDSILIDEARTPLIISGSAENDTHKILSVKKLVPYFKEVDKNPDGRYPDEADPFNPQKPVGDFKIDEKSKSISFTDDGMNKAEELLQKRNIIHGSLYIQENFEYIHYLTQALKSEYLFKNEVDYIVKNNEVMIVDEHTGRILEGRRYSDGLHQAIEAKENITVQRRSKTFAAITFQNFFRMYEKLSGMTGTADTEAAEFKNIYNLDVLVIPTNVSVIRIDHSDRVYLTRKEKDKSIVNEIKEIYKKGQPILIGTISVERSETLSNYLRKNNIRHNVLNAKNHYREAEIIAEAGRVGAVTIATNMAGRGTDIKLGGERRYDVLFEDLLQNEELTENDKFLLLDFKKIIDKMQLKEAESMIDKFSDKAKKGAMSLIESAYNWDEEHNNVKELGGLFVLGSERHESRRIDNQLRGRSGRQGDAGASRFYVSLEDDLMRLFGGEKIQRMLSGFGINENETIEHPWITGSIEKAQKKVESRNFDIRKRLLEFDDVLNLQRKNIYESRDDLLQDKNIIERVKQNAIENIEDLYDEYIFNLKTTNEYAVSELIRSFKDIFSFEINSLILQYSKNPNELFEKLKNLVEEDLNYKNKIIENLNEILKNLYLHLIDKYWQDHLENMEQLRDSVYLRSYSQKNPLIEYKIEGSTMFDNLILKIKSDVIVQIFKIKIETVDIKEKNSPLAYEHSNYNSFDSRGAVMKNQSAQQGSQAVSTATIVKNDKIGRNDPCPCGSGKKYKKCCGA